MRTISQNKLEELLIENADEPNHELIADAIMTKLRNKMIIETTTQLKKIITKALETLPQKLTADEINKTCQRCFQALRIEVNNEFGALEQFLEKLPDALAPGGRAAVLSFHSGEDRRVKKAFQYFFREGIYSAVAPDPIRASAEECFANRRARAAKLRWAVKV